MFKKICALMILGLVVLGFNSVILAQMEHMVETTAPVEVGNQICPVSGEKIDEKMKATYEYEGKIYNFCCPMCIEEFKKDPQKYIQKVNEELEAAKVEAVKEEAPAKTEPLDTQAAPGGHQHHH